MSSFISIDFGEDLEMGFSGPPLSEGTLPALLYFALSAKDSLCKDPYNQPVSYLATRPMRVFSVTLPFHEEPQDPNESLSKWAEAFLAGRDILTPFFDRVVAVIEKLVKLGFAVENQIGVSGLSRGAFVAAHIAAKSSFVRHILGFAPLTRLGKARGFRELHLPSFIESFDLHHLIDRLIGKNFKFFIGNRDELVGTSTCFSFIQQLAEASYQQKIRSPQAELVIFPSIGYQGHGTPKEIFEQGAEWMRQKLEVEHG